MSIPTVRAAVLGAPPSAAPFSPLSLSPALWLKADAGLWQNTGGTTPASADGDPVGRWDDQSGNGNNFTQGTSGKKPVLKTAILNGNPVVRLDGVDDDFSTSLTLGDYHLFFVVKQTGDGGILAALAANAPQTRIGQTGNKLSTYDGTNNPQSSTLGVAQGSWSLLEFSRASGTVSFRQNGNDYSTGLMTSPNTFTRFGSINGSLFLAGDVAEVIAYAASQATGPAAQVRAYAAARYALY